MASVKITAPLDGTMRTLTWDDSRGPYYLDYAEGDWDFLRLVCDYRGYNGIVELTRTGPFFEAGIEEPLQFLATAYDALLSRRVDLDDVKVELDPATQKELDDALYVPPGAMS